jgi:hypothetical protein
MGTFSAPVFSDTTGTINQLSKLAGNRRVKSSDRIVPMFRMESTGLKFPFQPMTHA